MRFSVDPGSTVSLADQIAAGIRRQIAEGELAPGDRLPPARDLAAATGVNLHTVLRGYHQLREEGLIELRRGRGARISSKATPEQAAFDQALREAAGLARRMGLEPEEAAAALVAAMQ